MEQSQRICPTQRGQSVDIKVFKHTKGTAVQSSLLGSRARWLRVSPKGVRIPASGLATHEPAESPSARVLTPLCPCVLTGGMATRREQALEGHEEDYMQ